MKAHVIYMDIWLFSGGRSRKVIWTKNCLSGHDNFFPNFSVWKTKSHVWIFGRDLAAIWKNQIFGYLVIWTDRWITAGTQYSIFLQSQFSSCDTSEYFNLSWTNIPKYFTMSQLDTLHSHLYCVFLISFHWHLSSIFILVFNLNRPYKFSTNLP